MSDWLIVITQASLIGLLMLLAFRMLMLTRSESATAPVPRVTASPFSRPSVPYQRQARETSTSRPSQLRQAELITQLHIVAGLQERDCRERGLHLPEAAEPVRRYAAAWLYGAANALCEPGERHSEALKQLVVQIAQRKAGASERGALAAIHSLTEDVVHLACYRCGLEGAEHWGRHHFVPTPSSLFDAVTSNAFI